MKTDKTAAVFYGVPRITFDLEGEGGIEWEEKDFVGRGEGNGGTAGADL